MKIRIHHHLRLLLLIASIIVCRSTSSTDGSNGNDETSYGVDVSFPVHKRISTNYPWLSHNVDPDNNPTPKQYEDMPLQPLGDRQAAYNKHLQGCREFYGKDARQCDVYEYDRMLMNIRQPQSMQNYTEVGFLKTRAPQEIIDLMTKFWEQNHLNQEQENWPVGVSDLKQEWTCV